MATQQDIRDRFRVHVLGVGNYYSEIHSTTSFLVEAGHRLVLVEAPCELPKKLRKYREALKSRCDAAHEEVPAGIDQLVLANINDFIITHVHGDHSAGLEGVAWEKMFHQERPILDKANWSIDWRRRPRIYGTHEVLDELKQSSAPSLTNKTCLVFEDFFDPLEVSHGRCFSIGGSTTLELYPSYHGVAGFSMLLSHVGRTLAYSSDTKFATDLIYRLSDADVLIHECDGTEVIHTSALQLSGWLSRSGYKGRLYVCHLDDKKSRAEECGLTALRENTFIDV
jgi:ribonuclease BN (tRNA processing enzyme)